MWVGCCGVPSKDCPEPRNVSSDRVTRRTLASNRRANEMYSRKLVVRHVLRIAHIRVVGWDIAWPPHPRGTQQISQRARARPRHAIRHRLDVRTRTHRAGGVDAMLVADDLRIGGKEGSVLMDALRIAPAQDASPMVRFTSGIGCGFRTHRARCAPPTVRTSQNLAPIWFPHCPTCVYTLGLE